MAVQAQCPCRSQHLDSDRKKDMDYPQAAPGFVDASATLFANGAAWNTRKRGKDTASVSMAPPTPLPVPNSLLPSSSFISDELVARMNLEKQEIEQFLHAHGEQLRRTLAERRRSYCRSILIKASETAAMRLREKEADVERAAQRRVELEECLARLRTESMAWQAKARAGQAEAASLYAQFQLAAAVAPPEKGGESAEDAGSSFIDPDRIQPDQACRACRRRMATVVLLPCRHLCLCEVCGGVHAESCPVCCCVRTGSVRVFLA